MPTVTITGPSVRDSLSIKDNRPWYVWAAEYQDGGDGGVVTPRSSKPIYPSKGILTFKVEAGIAVWIKNPDGQKYLVTTPLSNAPLWDVIAAGVAYPPDTRSDILATAVGQFVDVARARFRTRAVPITSGPDAGKYQWVDEEDTPTGDPVPLTDIVPESVAQAAAEAVAPGVVDADISGRNVTVQDVGGGNARIAIGGVNAGPAFPLPGGTWSGLTGKPAAMAAGATPIEARKAVGVVGVNVKSDYGATADGSTDDAPAIQNAINAVRDLIRADYRNNVVVFIPAGVYRLNSQIVHPPYVKVVALGSVVFETYIASDSAWHITPLSDDPTNLYAPMKKQQWLVGRPLNGAQGGITFINRNSTTGSSVGLELNARTDLGITKPLCRYTLCDIAIQHYGIGLQWNVYHHYIATYERFHIENCTKLVQIGTGDGVTPDAAIDSGENITWRDCVFAAPIGSGTTTPVAGNGAMFTWGAAAIDMNFVACSFDFGTTVFKFLYGYQQVNVFGGHIEGINLENWETPTGGIAVSAVASNSQYPEVHIDRPAYVTGQSRGTLFRGYMYLDIAMTLRSNAFTVADLDYDKAYLCDSQVRVMKNAYRTRGGGPSLARQCNIFKDPVFAADTVGASGKALTYWENDTFGGTYTCVVDSDSPVAGGKSLLLTMTGSVYTRYTCKTFLPCRPNDRLNVKCVYKFSATTPTANLTVAITWFDSDKVQIGAVEQTNLFRTHTIADDWSSPDGHVTSTAPPGACFFKVGIQVGTAAGDGVVQYRISDFHAYIGG